MGFDVSKFLKGVEGEGKRRMLHAGEKAVESYANHVLGEAQRICPVSPTNPKDPGYTGHSGNLKSSATAEEPVTRGQSITCKIGFNASYAAAVHERLDAEHSQGEAKYLERPMQREAHKLVSFVKEEMRKAL